MSSNLYEIVTLYFNPLEYLQCLVKIHVLVQVFIAVKRHHVHTKSYTEGIYLGWLTYSFRGSVYYHHNGKHVACGAGTESPTSYREEEVNCLSH